MKIIITLQKIDNQIVAVHYNESISESNEIIKFEYDDSDIRDIIKLTLSEFDEKFHSDVEIRVI